MKRRVMLALCFIMILVTGCGTKQVEDEIDYEEEYYEGEREIFTIDELKKEKKELYLSDYMHCEIFDTIYGDENNVDHTIFYLGEMKIDYAELCNDLEPNLKKSYTRHDVERLFDFENKDFEEVALARFECTKDFSDDLSTIEVGEVLTFTVQVNEAQLTEIMKMTEVDLIIEESYEFVTYDYVNMYSEDETMGMVCQSKEMTSDEIGEIGANGINMMDYITVRQKGMDGYGTVEVDFNEHTFYQTCKYFLREDYSMGDIVSKYYMSEYQNTELMNGDLIDITAKMTDESGNMMDISEYLTVSVIPVEISLQVEGLKECGPIDVFEYASSYVYSFYGVDVFTDIELPNGEWIKLHSSVGPKESDIPYDSYEVGDKYKVDFSRAVKDYVAEYGEEFFPVTEKELVVETVITD